MNNVSIAQCLRRFNELENVSDTARLDTELLLMEVLQKDRSYLYAWSDKTLSLKQQESFTAYFSRRLLGEPVAHILGYREFWSLPLNVDNSTLIPRPDTERIVELVLDLFAQDLPKQTRHLLDLGTGTGAILLAIAKEKTHWMLLGVDKFTSALTLAEKNRAQFGFNHVRIEQSDWFTQIVPQEFDVIVANPPYLAADDPHLAQGDLRFEPHTALVAAQEGYADIQHIIEQSWNYLTNNGWLVLEHGFTQAAQVRNSFMQRGYSQVETYRDYGGNERVTIGQKLIPE